MKGLEFNWQGVPEWGNGVFTHILSHGFCTPSELLDSPVDSDIRKLAKLFVKQVELIAPNYATNQVLFPLGCDFAWKNAAQTYGLLDRIINQIHSFPT